MPEQRNVEHPAALLADMEKAIRKAIESRWKAGGRTQAAARQILRALDPFLTQVHHRGEEWAQVRASVGEALRASAAAEVPADDNGTPTFCPTCGGPMQGGLPQQVFALGTEACG